MLMFEGGYDFSEVPTYVPKGEKGPHIKTNVLDMTLNQNCMYRYKIPMVESSMLQLT
jgi:hypothetical protein